MKITTLLLTSAFAASALVQAADVNESEFSRLTEDEISDIRVECIELGVSSELDGDQMDEFVEKCVKAELAIRENNRDGQG
ncbi:MAG: hypothetical protein EP297_08285 [Gammaproteobacteria bacterium]|nr:MAG: hypothetical protein EP297_08285 [Gammaproteobacteria bacterium]